MGEPRQRSRRAIVAAVIALSCSVHAARAQVAPRLELGGNIEVGGEAERYLRALQLVGLSPLYPWTMQEFTPAEARRLAPHKLHPWSLRFDALPSAGELRLLRPKGRLIFNSAFPVQDGHGPTWAGRGVTGELQFGFAAQWGRLRLQVAPVVFLAQNRAFTLAPNGLSGTGSFADARFPKQIDYPQRFGEEQYGRVDVGTSTLSLDLPGIALGVSNAPQRWGPSIEYPLVLGPGAGGFPHIYAGTSAPVNLWLFRLHVRLIAGILSQSQYSPKVSGGTDRFASAAVVSLTPRGIEGLELGFIRFFETSGGGSLFHLLRPFSGLLSPGNRRSVDILGENQTASAFLRWALPAAGVEIYAEVFREDYSGNFRAFVGKPDDLASYTLGLQHAFASSAHRLRVIRAEVVNGELSHQETGQRGADSPIPPYTHTEVPQGHTLNGLLLGSPEAYGGAGWRISLEQFTGRGRQLISIERALRLDWLPGQPADAPDIHPDVIFALRLEMVRFDGPRDYALTLSPSIDLNRNLQPGQDRFNLHASVTLRGLR